MGSGPIKICCEDSPEFGGILLEATLYCDHNDGGGVCSFDTTPCDNIGLPCPDTLQCSGTGAPCDTPDADCPDVATCTEDGSPCSDIGAICPDPVSGSGVCVGTAGGTCVVTSHGDCIPATPVAGTTGYSWEDAPTFDFTNNGPGLITVNFSVDVSACLDVIAGTGTTVPIPGDQIHVYYGIEIVCASPGTDPILMDITPSGMTPTGDNILEATVGAFGGGSITCGLTGTLNFTDTTKGDAWINSCPCSIRFFGFVRAEDSLGSPTTFAISGTVNLSGSVTGTCCGPHSITYP